MRITSTKLEEVKILEYDLRTDNRGTSFHNFSMHELIEAGIKTNFIEENVYCPESAGTLYGIHYQNHPYAQTKLLYCIAGRGLDYAVDLRKDSPTYKQWVCVELTPENRRQIYIPRGFGHAFLSMEDHTKVVMRIDQYFYSDYSKQIKWNDPQLNVKFPITDPILAPHDVNAPDLDHCDCNLRSI